VTVEALHGAGQNRRNDFIIFNSLLISLKVSLLHLRLVEKLLLVWVHTVLNGHRLEFVDHLGLPNHLKLLLLQRLLLSAEDLLAHVQLLWDLLHRLV